MGKLKRFKIPREVFAADKEAELAHTIAVALRAGWPSIAAHQHPAEARFVAVAITKQLGPRLERSLDADKIPNSKRRQIVHGKEYIYVSRIVDGQKIRERYSIEEATKACGAELVARFLENQKYHVSANIIAAAERDVAAEQDVQDAVDQHIRRQSGPCRFGDLIEKDEAKEEKSQPCSWSASSKTERDKEVQHLRPCDIVWRDATGKWPKGWIIHLDGNLSDDRFENLKLMPWRRQDVKIKNPRSNVSESVLSSYRRYLKRIYQQLILEPQEEYTLAKAWHDHVEVVAKQLNVSTEDIIELADLGMSVGGIKHIRHVARQLGVTMSEVIDLSHRSRCLLQGDVALEKLVVSHLRLVTRIANRHFGRGLEKDDLIAEGTIGLIKAAERFNLDQKARLSTYAAWWITGAIRDYVVRMSSLVKIGTTDAQKTIFFNLQEAKDDFNIIHDEDDMRPDQVELLAKDLNVKKQEVIEMNRRLARDVSLNAPIYNEYGKEIGERIDRLIDGDCQPQKNEGAWWFSRDNQESALIKQELLEKRSEAFAQAVANLDNRKQRVIKARHSAYKPIALEDLADELKISHERVRQIEADAELEIQKEIDATAANLKAERTSKKKAEHRPLPYCISKHFTPEVLEAIKQLRKKTPSCPCRVYTPEQRAEIEQHLHSQGRLPNATEIERLAFKAYNKARQEAVKQSESIKQRDAWKSGNCGVAYPSRRKNEAPNE